MSRATHVAMALLLISIEGVIALCAAHGVILLFTTNNDNNTSIERRNSRYIYIHI